MLLPFQDCFAPFIEEGSKTHTIRGERKYPPRVGEICHCYTGLRTKSCRLLGRFECTRVEPIRIDVFPFGPCDMLTVEISGVRLSLDETSAFFERDGFRDRLVPQNLHVMVYSESQGQYWRENGRGYTLDRLDAWLLPLKDAQREISEIVQRDKKINFVPLWPAIQQARAFWKKYHAFPFEGQLIHWKYDFTKSGGLPGNHRFEVVADEIRRCEELNKSNKT